MKINWNLRFQNKYTVTALITCLITFVYNILETLEIVPAIAEDSIIALAETVVMILVSVGILIDPTTSGTDDSELAMNRQSIKK